MKKNRLEKKWNLFGYSAFAKAVLLTTILLVSCSKKKYQLDKMVGSKTAIDSSLQGVADIENYIAPFKKSLDVQMNEQISYNPASMHKNDTRYNTAIGNMLAAIVREQSAPVYKSRTGKEIDVILLNHGGIRAGMPAGAVTMRSAYEIMPFDNEMVIVELTGDKMNELIQYLIKGKKAHPIDGLQIILNNDNTVKKVSIQGKSLDLNKTYVVATSDYLYTGGDNMNFFKDAPMTEINYKIRNAMIDYFQKVDTLRFENDDRFTVIK